ncbi:MAG: hypothetical protein FWD13_11565 [Treponema sp.]|nr:hypothetical protein [Treponema sp.]
MKRIWIFVLLVLIVSVGLVFAGGSSRSSECQRNSNCYFESRDDYLNCGMGNCRVAMSRGFRCSCP